MSFPRFVPVWTPRSVGLHEAFWNFPVKGTPKCVGLPLGVVLYLLSAVVVCLSGVVVSGVSPKSVSPGCTGVTLVVTTVVGPHIDMTTWNPKRSKES